MDLAAFARGVSFRFLQPDTWGPGLWTLKNVLARTPWPLDVLNTRLPEREAELRSRLSGPLKVPRLSTFAIGALINQAVRGLDDEAAYVNVGVWNGFTYLAGMAGNPEARCIGVDNWSLIGGPKEAFHARFEEVRGPAHSFHDMGYEEYFTKVHEGPIGFYFYDGIHEYEDQVRGLEVAEPFLTEDAWVLVDDTNHAYVRQATLDYLESTDLEFEVAFEAGTCRTLHPTWWNGVMLLRRTG